MVYYPFRSKQSARWKNLGISNDKKLEFSTSRSDDGTDGTGRGTSWAHFTLMCFLEDVLKLGPRCCNLSAVTPYTENNELNDNSNEHVGPQFSIWV
jgi:hypothetical protein